MCTPGTIANLQPDRRSTKINKTVLFSETMDTIRHLKTSRVVSNEMLIVLLILC